MLVEVINGDLYIDGVIYRAAREALSTPIVPSFGLDSNGNLIPLNLDALGQLAVVSNNYSWNPNTLAWEKSTSNALLTNVHLQLVLNRPPDRVATNEDETISYYGWAEYATSEDSDTAWIMCKMQTVDGVQERHWTDWDFSNKWSDYLDDDIYY